MARFMFHVYLKGDKAPIYVQADEHRVNADEATREFTRDGQVVASFGTDIVRGWNKVVDELSD